MYSNNIIIQVDKITGALFYALEYYIFLKEKGNPFNLIVRCTLDIKSKIILTIKDKYLLEYSDTLIDDIKFIHHGRTLYSNTLIVLDFSTFKLLNKKLIYKKCFYNYTNEKDSIVKNFNEFSSLKNVIPFGDKTISKVQYHFPLLLNFKMFKKIKEFENKVLEPILNITSVRPIYQEFHKSFRKLKYHHTQFDRANRLIPECKFYNKEIEIIDYGITGDSISRINKDIKELDINNSLFWEFLNNKGIK